MLSYMKWVSVSIIDINNYFENCPKVLNAYSNDRAVIHFLYLIRVWYVSYVCIIIISFLTKFRPHRPFSCEQQNSKQFLEIPFIKIFVKLWKPRGKYHPQYVMPTLRAWNLNCEHLYYTANTELTQPPVFALNLQEQTLRVWTLNFAYVYIHICF